MYFPQLSGDRHGGGNFRLTRRRPTPRVGCGRAYLHAASRADELLAKADLDGCRTWRLIFKAIGELATIEKPVGATSH